MSREPQAAHADLSQADCQPRVGHIAAPAGVAILLSAAFAVALDLGCTATSLGPVLDDPMYANGTKRSQAEIVEFMKQEVMPWARVALGRIKGGPNSIICVTCHGPDGESSNNCDLICFNDHAIVLPPHLCIGVGGSSASRI